MMTNEEIQAACRMLEASGQCTKQIHNFIRRKLKIREPAVRLWGRVLRAAGLGWIVTSSVNKTQAFLNLTQGELKRIREVGKVMDRRIGILAVDVGYKIRMRKKKGVPATMVYHEDELLGITYKMGENWVLGYKKALDGSIETVKYRRWLCEFYDARGCIISLSESGMLSLLGVDLGFDCMIKPEGYDEN